MTKTKVTLTVLALFTLSGCSSFDMSMLNPFSSDDEEVREVNQPIEQEVTEEQLKSMYREWRELKQELMAVVNLDSEISSLKSQLAQQSEALAAIQSAQQEMTDTMKSSMQKPAMMDNMQNSMSANGAFSLQIAAASSIKAAEQAWRGQLRRFSSFLSSYTPQYSKLQTRNGEFYRVKVGSFETKEQASNSCASLQRMGGQCMVRKN